MYTSRLIIQCHKKVTQEKLIKKHGKGGILLYNGLERGKWRKLENNYSDTKLKLGKYKEGESWGTRGKKLN